MTSNSTVEEVIDGWTQIGFQQDGHMVNGNYLPTVPPRTSGPIPQIFLFCPVTSPYLKLQMLILQWYMKWFLVTSYRQIYADPDSWRRYVFNPFSSNLLPSVLAAHFPPYFFSGFLSEDPRVGFCAESGPTQCAPNMPSGLGAFAWENTVPGDHTVEKWEQFRAIFLLSISYFAMLLFRIWASDIVFLIDNDVVTDPSVAVVAALAQSLDKEVITWRNDARTLWTYDLDPVYTSA